MCVQTCSTVSGSVAGSSRRGSCKHLRLIDGFLFLFLFLDICRFLEWKFGSTTISSATDIGSNTFMAVIQETILFHCLQGLDPHVGVFVRNLASSEFMPIELQLSANTYLILTLVILCFWPNGRCKLKTFLENLLP